MVSLYSHQKAELEATKDLDHVAYFHDMGLGKTFTGAEKMWQLGAVVNLVVCQKSKVQDWLDHFNEHYPIIETYDLTQQSEIDEFLETAEYQDCAVGVINYELVWRRPELNEVLRNFTLLLDESSLIQNEAAKRTKFILKMQPKNVILLSGTPTGGKYERLWSQLHLLGWSISKGLYWKQYVDVKYLDTVGRSIPIVSGYKNVDRLKRKMAQYGCRFLKSDEVFDMPEQTFIKVRVESSDAYRTFKKRSIIKIDGDELVGDTSLTKMLYERQLCGIYSEAKLQAFADLAESTDDRLIVFYNFTAELEKLRALCVKNGWPFSIVNGETKSLSNYELEDSSITFVQYQAGAMGLNLQKANKVIYYSLPLSSELYEQSKKRVHRIGQERPCFYYLLLCKGSIEEKILAALQVRKDYTEKLFQKGE